MVIINNKKIEILDSTLRDGAQGHNISFSVNDKLNIVKALDAFGVSYIEAGNPGSNAKDLEFFQKVKELQLTNAKLCAFGSTRRKNIKAEEDSNLRALLSADTEVVVIFGKSWDLHVTDILKTTAEENLNMISDTIQFLIEQNRSVIFDAEHFFDGYKSNPDYALDVIKTAAESGAITICLCDTNGGLLPLEMHEIVKKVSEKFPTINLAIHAHNDSGCAAANSIAAVQAGVMQVQGTFNGIGERCGNADLSVIIPNLILKCSYGCDGNLSEVSQTAQAIAEFSNINIEGGRPYVGRSAFTHKAGMHIDGVLKNSVSFEHVGPETVGNKRAFLVSEVAGRGSILQKIQPYAPNITKESKELDEIIKQLKDLEHFGYHFEAADASFELLVKRIVGTYKPHFKLVFYKAMDEFPVAEGELSACATIKVLVDGKTEMTAASGYGPVNALDNALRKALAVFFPSLCKMHLSDYKVRVLNSQATESKVRVLIESMDNHESWCTIGVSQDIIEASLIALIDSIEYKLSKEDLKEDI